MRGVVSIADPSQPLMAYLAKAVALGGDDSRIAQAELARTMGMPDKVIKALQAPMATSDADMAGLADSLTILTSFIPMMRSTSVFFRLLDGMMLRLPLRTRVSFITGAASMAIVNEAQTIKVSRLASDKVFLEPHRSTGILVFTKEMLAWFSVAGEAFLSTELRRAIAASVDTGFLSLIGDGSTPNRASVGVSPEAAASDLKFLLDSCELTADSRPLFALAPDVARRAATLYDSNAGGFVFPMMSPQGGELLKIPAIVTDALPAGTIALFDGMAIAGDAEGVEIVSARHASLQLDSTPDSPPTASTNPISLWQHDLAGIMPKVYFGAQRLRASAYSYVSGVAWGSGDSPA